MDKGKRVVGLAAYAKRNKRVIYAGIVLLNGYEWAYPDRVLAKRQRPPTPNPEEPDAKPEECLL